MKNVENVILKNIEQNGKLSTSDIEKIKQISEQEGKGLVKILRDENFRCMEKDIYPCGEGAGYAGGIMSAAMDGMKVAEAYIRSLQNRG